MLLGPENKRLNPRVVHLFLTRFKAHLGSIGRKLEMAGRPFSLQPLEFVGLQQVSVILFVLLGGMALATIGFLNAASVLVLLLMGAVLPRVWLSETINARHKAIARGPPLSTTVLTPPMKGRPAPRRTGGGCVG